MYVLASFVFNPCAYICMMYMLYRYGFTYTDDSVVTGGIPDGRWAYMKADLNDKYPDLLAGYGYMRAPWNMNPR